MWRGALISKFSCTLLLNAHELSLPCVSFTGGFKPLHTHSPKIVCTVHASLYEMGNKSQSLAMTASDCHSVAA